MTSHLPPLPYGEGARRRVVSDLIRGMDHVLLLAVLALSAIGSLLVWSATRMKLENAGTDPREFFYRHLVNIALGLAMMLLVILADYTRLRASVPLAYLVACLGLVLVLTPLGVTINGSHSWIRVAGQSIQPSELAKVALVAAIAVVLAEPRDRGERPGTFEVLVVLGLAAVPVLLVLAQPDLGTIMVLVSIVFGMLFASGVRMAWVIGLLTVGVTGAVVAVQAGVLSQYQLNRFAAFANPALDPRGVGYNTNQARIAIGSGGLTGKGLFAGTQTNGQFVPEQQTDFIFTVAGEELGFVGAGLILALFAVVFWRALRIARRATDLFELLIAAGVVSWFGFQTFENIGMTIGIMPVTGLPLPFVSYGGTAMFACLIAVGLLQNVHLQQYRRR